MGDDHFLKPDNDVEGASPTGPVYEAGEGRIVSAGWMSENGAVVLPFRVVVEFPCGPPDIPFHAIWKCTPVRLVLAKER